MKIISNYTLDKYSPIFILIILMLSIMPSFAADKVFFYHTDATGTPMAMTDSSGIVVWQADYKPFGEEHTVSGSVENKNKFVGKEKDEETDLYYFGARYLDARSGRFIKPDPVGITESDLANPQRFNRYAYGLNNPYRVIDPDGNIPIDTIWDAGNILYDIATGDWKSLAADAAALAIPYVPAGITKVTKVANKIDDAVDVSKTIEKGKVVIGENMKDRVIPTADKLGADYYKSRNKIEDIGMEKALKNNERWLRKKIKEGKEIVDIGPDPNRAKRSPFYKREQEVLKKYQ